MKSKIANKLKYEYHYAIKDNWNRVWLNFNLLHILIKLQEGKNIKKIALDKKTIVDYSKLHY
jgi:hypothetical protein